jgi:hypothetical protein
VQNRRVVAKAVQEPDGFRMDLSLRLAAGAEGMEVCCAEPVQDGFRHDRTRRVAGAEEQDVEGTVRHSSAPPLNPGSTPKRRPPLPLARSTIWRNSLRHE